MDVGMPLLPLRVVDADNILGEYLPEVEATRFRAGVESSPDLRRDGRTVAEPRTARLARAAVVLPLVVFLRRGMSLPLCLGRDLKSVTPDNPHGPELPVPLLDPFVPCGIEVETVLLQQ